MAHPVCAEVNNSIQQLTDVQYNTSEQHKVLTTARQGKDMRDSCELLEFLESRNPFSDNCRLRSIATGINAGISVTVDTAEEVGRNILTSMAQQNVLQHSFKKKDQAVTLSTSAVKVNNETIQIDPQLLFQRLIAAGTRNDQLEEIFQFELCSYPPAIFEAIYVMRSANKPALADAIWALVPKYVVGPTGQSQYVLDGGSLVHRIPWQRGTTYNDICRRYTNYITRRYGHAIIVFDGYHEELSTKYGAHERRTGGRAGPTVDSTRDKVMQSKKEDLLSNKDNNQRFIRMLGQSLEHVGCETRHAKGDADVLIVETTVQYAMSCETTLVGDDTDLLVLLCFQGRFL